jgi:hypothetical protein
MTIDLMHITHKDIKKIAKNLPRKEVEAGYTLHYTSYHDYPDKEAPIGSPRCHDPTCPFTFYDFDEALKLAIIRDSERFPEYRQLFPEYFKDKKK